MPAAIQPILYTVSGIVYDEYNSPLANAPVKLFDIDLRSEQQLGQTKADDKGFYKINFKADAAAAPEHHAPDVQLRVYGERNKLLGESPVFFNVQQETIIDYKIGGTQNKGANEFDLLLQKIEPVIKPSTITLGQLEENDKHKDISFIAGETGEDIARISFINTAYAFFKQTKIAPEFFYGWFRLGFPTVLNELLMIKTQSIINALKQAMKENIISSKWEKSLDEIIKIFNSLSVKKLLEDNDERSAAFKKLFGSALNAAQQKTFVSAYFDKENEPEKFWDYLKTQTGFTSAAAVKKVQQLLSFNLLTGNQPDLAQHLLSTQASDADLKELSGFAKFSAADWKKHIKEAAVSKFPEWVIGDTKGEKIDHYAESLEQLHKQLYPASFFAARMKQDAQSSIALKTQLNTFFGNNPNFKLDIRNVHKQLEAASFKNISNKEGVIKELKTLNRLYKLTDDYKQVNELYRKQLFSSADIVRKYGREQFVKEFSTITGSVDTAAKLYSNAISVNNKTMALITAYKMRNDVKVYAINGDAPDQEEYHEMFGDGEVCECEHCQSVYSPSAYFVDMLHFIDGNSEAAHDELLRRRPDLDDILLTCKNTNTPLPYIDLVNELLEKQVLKLSGVTEIDGVLLAAHSFQTEGIAAELIAMPEHSNSGAYENLKTVVGDAVFSAVLPIDLPLEEIRTYTEKLGWKRYELMDVFYGNNEPGKMSDPILAAELFGFSKAELETINGTNAFTVTLPGNIKELLEKTKLTYIELLQLLETYFLNPTTDGARSISITQVVEGTGEQLLTCNLDKLLLTGADNAWLNKLVRFVRLWKKLGWDIFDLDRTLTVLGTEDFSATETTFNEQLLVPLAHIEKTKRLLNIPVRQGITFFGNIDTAVYLDHTKEGQPVIPSLYEQVFQDKTVIDDFLSSPFNAVAENLSGVLTDHAETVSAVLGITAAEFTILAPAGELSIQNVSRLYRDVLLARSLKAPVADVKEILKITGKVTTTGIWSPVLLSEFLEEWKIFKSSGIKADEFYSIITNNTGANYELPVNNSLIQFVQQNIDALNTIKNDTANTEEQRKIKYAESLNQFLISLSENATLMNALAPTLSSQDDNALKNSIQSYLGENNKEALHLLTGDELIDKLGKLKTSFSEYLFLKTTPQIFKQFRFLPDEVKWLERRKAATGTGKLWDSTIDVTDTGLYPAFRRLVHIWLIAKIKTNAVLSWTELFDIAIKNEPNAKAEWFRKCIILYAVAESSLIFLCGAKDEVNSKGRLNFAFPDGYINAENLLAILNCCRIIEKLGGNNDQLRALLTTTVEAEDAQAVKNLLKSKYGNKEWSDIIKPINDKLRTKRRDALVAWLLANTNGSEWHSTNDIYEWLLIDTEMDACMVTSRIKQGISSVQLYIDRCLMNLETISDTTTVDPHDRKTIIFGTEFSEQWHTWRKQYRVWEANRKIFLYPENWIEPDLRDDKSPFFEELESQLKQNEVTEDTAEEALITYLQKLDSVAKLEMVGLFNDEEENIVHVFGRTQNVPHQYYYRKQQYDVWTAWEKVDVDIEGDHILPVVWNGRLMLFWAQFTEKQDSNTGGKTTITGGSLENLTMTTPEPVTFLEMKLAWSEYKKGKWGTKKISKETVSKIELLPKPSGGKNDQTTDERILLKSQFLICSAYQGDSLWIHLFQKDAIDKIGLTRIYNNLTGSFLFNPSSSTPEIFEDNVNPFYSVLQGIENNRLLLDGSEYWDELKISKQGFFNSDNEFNGVEVLSRVTGETLITPILHNILTNKDNFLFDGNANCYYVIDRSISSIPEDVNSMSSEGFVLKRRVHSGASLGSSPGIKLGSSPKTAVYNVRPSVGLNTQDKYLFLIFYHPFISKYIKSINTKGIPDIYTKHQQTLENLDLFQSKYAPTTVVVKPYPKEEVDFSFTGSYSLYNWELFYYIPLLIATRLTQNQKFEEARKWFHYIFDPTKSSNNETGAERFWITKPFRKEIIEGVLSLEDLLNREEHADELEVQLANWEKNPFNPHAVARLRISAYMRNTVLRYIDNLIQWGDQLFRRDTIESINEATLLYILASNILGKKAEVVPARAKPVEKSFSLIKDELDPFSNIKSEIESYISPSSGDDNILMPYFCLPKNDHLLKYWDTVSDRLFKIRHCMNIEGVVRQLPLFEPPIDPALLVRATAAGLDLNLILNDMNAGLPNYRFQVMLQQANETCNDVKSLGSSLLSALEKKDGEELALLRCAHELKMLEMIKDIKQKQRDEAKESLAGLMVSRSVIEDRFLYYDSRSFMNSSEKLREVLLGTAWGFQSLSSASEALAGLLLATPDTMIGTFSFGVNIGGSYWGAASRANASIFGMYANTANTLANLAGTMGSYQRRMDDWKFQAKSAELELKQIAKQIIAAEIRLAIAEKEIENHYLQMEQSKEVDDYIRSKFTNAELYDWMVGQLSTVYFQSYQLGYATAKKAEKCMQHELGLQDTGYIQFGYWDSLKKGLLSGEKLQYDLRRLENAYLEQNKRAFEITKHISLVSINPLALLQLKETGKCDINLPEELFDLDFPGHYFRRTKSISVSIPCIAGPYTSVNATLRLTENQYRIDKTATDAPTYIKTPEEISNPGSGRFRSGSNPVSAIATSSAQNDSGMFELNFRDERYLPFEGAGVASTWQLELMKDKSLRQFDYDTISDVILHVKYTAQDGGESLKAAAIENLKNVIIDASGDGRPLAFLFDVRHEFANEWHRFITPAGTEENVNIELSVSKDRLPFFAANKNVEATEVILLAKKKEGADRDSIPFVSDQMIFDDSVNLFKAIVSNSPINITEESDFVFSLTMLKTEVAKLEGMYLLLNYKLS